MTPRHHTFATRLLTTSALLLGMTISSFAIRAVPENLGNGLDKIVESNLAVKSGAPALFNGFTSKAAESYAKIAITDAASGRYLVDIMPDGSTPVATFRSALETAFPLMSVTAVDPKYAGHGAIEAYVSIDDVPRLARTAGVMSVVLQIKPVLNAGQSVSQGVLMHRVNKINKGYNAAAPKNWDGAGLSIGVMSDSFDASATTSDRAAADQAADELPSGDNMVVLEDLALGSTPTDEGRGMCQIVHDIAPAAKIGFATAFNGNVSFANNIRALAGLSGFTKPGQTFKGDVVCDDVSYLDEPMFQDGIIAQAVNDVVAAGVTYASSAANNWGTDGYASVFRPVANGTGNTAATNSALAGTNIDLTGVDPSLYAGGFHNFNPNGLDVAQLMNTGGSDNRLVFQWNDPYDQKPPQKVGAPIFEADGVSAACSEMDFKPPAFTAGKAYVIEVYATPPNPNIPPEDFDAIVRVTDPNGKVILDQDTGVDEVVTFFAPVSGQYTITVHPFAANPPVCTQGHYHVKVSNATGVGRITQDFNLLFFDTDGKFIQAVATNNFVTNRPIEFASLSLGADQTQLVIARSNTSAVPDAANQLKYVWFGNGASDLGPAEYNNYLTPVTFGHSAAAGANSVAAYEGFKPTNVPEYFTSPGPVVIYFDADGNRLATPEVRLKPDIAATDGVDTSFFPLGVIPFMGVPLVGDSQNDMDDYPNFYGTSAASPHCAALAALVLQSHGGSKSLTPAQVKTIFQTTAFPHDLDPYFSSGTAVFGNGGTVAVSVTSDDSANANTGANDPNSWSISYTGPGILKSISFNPEGTPQTGGNPTGGNFTGVTPSDYNDTSKFHYTPGMVFTSKFLFGPQSVGLKQSDVVQSRSNPAPFPANPSPGNTTAHEWTLNLGFPNNNFTDGKVLRFNNGRSQWQDATVPQGQTITPFLVRRGDYSADNLGDGVFIPEDPDGFNVKPGMTFEALVDDGGKTYKAHGRLTNRVGRGYSPLDGFGFINAEAAVAAPVPTATPAASPPPIQLVNMSGRMSVGTGDNVGIGGFIVTGNTSKRVLLRGLGPSLAARGVNGSLQDPIIELHDSSGAVTTNDNWKSSQQAEIEQTGLAPSDDREAALVTTLPPGNHTVILRGANNATGVGLAEIYDLQADVAELGNLSMRADVQSDDNVLIAGIIVRAGDPRNVLLRGLGPELAAHNVQNALQDPLMELHDANGATMATNDNWQDAPNAAAIQATGIPPADQRESAILMPLGPGQYTSIVRGSNGATGVGQVEAYKLNQ